MPTSKLLVGFLSLSSLLIGCKIRKHNEATRTLSQSRLSGEPNSRAGDAVVYEAQIRTANACEPSVGSAAQRAACAKKIAPKIVYRAEDKSCANTEKLLKIKMGTVEDFLADTSDYRQGITLRYIQEKVGANTVWVMPLFPNNDVWNIPADCDNLGSPYAVRDYFHVAGSQSRACIEKNRDEYSAEPCWGNEAFDSFLNQAGSRNLSVMLDLAFNHFGHNYLTYDYVDFTPIRERIARSESLDTLNDFDATYEHNLVRPEILDTRAKLMKLVETNSFHQSQYNALLKKCPDLKNETDLLVRYYNMWRIALEHERQGSFQCNSNNTADRFGRGFLEFNVPGFFAGADKVNPSENATDIAYSKDWPDVKRLFLHDENVLKSHQYYRNREYLFRIMNYWASRGVSAFRLDHTSDEVSGIDAKDWDYLLSKVAYYAAKRGQKRPFFMAEEFHDQEPMRHVVDAMTEGYVGDMLRPNPKTVATIENVLSNKRSYHQDLIYTMTALETHDETRLMENSDKKSTGLNMWTGSGFWGIGATTWSMPMIVMGQEFGEPWGIGFKQSDYIRGRFEGTANDRGADGNYLREFYRLMATSRLANENRALRAKNIAYLHPKDGATGEIFAAAKWSDDSNVMFVFHNLWEQNSSAKFYLEPGLDVTRFVEENRRYRLFDVISKREVLGCQSGASLRWEIPIDMNANDRAYWLRLESCE